MRRPFQGDKESYRKTCGYHPLKSSAVPLLSGFRRRGRKPQVGRAKERTKTALLFTCHLLLSTSVKSSHYCRREPHPRPLSEGEGSQENRQFYLDLPLAAFYFPLLSFYFPLLFFYFPLLFFYFPLLSFYFPLLSFYFPLLSFYFCLSSFYQRLPTL